MITDEPSMDWVKVVGGFFLYLGGLFFLASLHVLTLSFDGGVADVIRTFFVVLLWVFVAAAVFGVVGVIIQFFRWLTYEVTTPKWVKSERRGGKVGR